MSKLDDAPWWGEDDELLRDLDAERAADGPPPEAAERVLAQVMALANAPVPPPAGPDAAPTATTTAQTAGTATTTAGGVKLWVVAGLGVLVLGGAGLLVATQSPETPAPAAVAVAPALTAPKVDVPAPPPIVEPTPPAPAEPPPVVQATAPPVEPAAPAVPSPRPRRVRREAPAPVAPLTPPTTLDAERALLHAARRALQAGDLAAAMRQVETHASTFKTGQLAEARELLRVQILVREGRMADARAAADAFRRRFPSSLLGPALEEALPPAPEAP